MAGYKNFFEQQHASATKDRREIIDHSFYRPLLRFAETRHQVACKMLGKEHFKNALELGCGKGGLIPQIMDQLDHYTGLDISAVHLSLIPEAVRQNPKVTVREYDLNHPLDFADQGFDLVLSLGTLEYLFDPIAFVKEIFRILTPGGILILHTMNLAFILRRLQLLFGKLPTFNSLPGWQGGNLHDFTFPTLRKLLQSTGFEITDSRCAGLAPALRMWWPNLLASDMLLRVRKPPVKNQ